MKAKNQFNDSIQEQIQSLVAAFLTALKNFAAEKAEIYRQLLGLALARLSSHAEFAARLRHAGLAKSTANEISQIFRYRELAESCREGKIAVRQAIKEARARNRGDVVAPSDEERLLKAADKVLGNPPQQGSWRMEGKTWILEFVAAQGENGENTFSI